MTERNGSSPRAWGTPEPSERSAGSVRFIPTRVGNTPRRRSGRGSFPVHPHARGEHRYQSGTTRTITGSSPRAWGTRLHRQSRGGGRRFIPTRVGNTHPDDLPPNFPAVHPHARGEHPRRRALRSSNFGSSPRAWGTLRRQRLRSSFSRFIPTRVGNTFPRTAWWVVHPVHPHARGEHQEPADAEDYIAGSSPRAWGTLTTDWSSLARIWFIPTRVGNTFF